MNNLVDRSFDWLGGLLLPPRCVLCGGHGQPPCLDLCAGCAAELPVGAQRVTNGEAALRRIFAPFTYAPPVDYLVQSLKYRGHLANGRVLGTLLGGWIEALGLHHDVDVIVPVPLHPARLAARGFNQSAEIARWVARGPRIRFDPRLAVRCHDTRPQVGLTVDQRSSNLAGAFSAAPAVRGLRVALVDDVTTTGCTLQQLAMALIDQGATTVDAWCVARADRRVVHFRRDISPPDSQGP